MGTSSNATDSGESSLEMGSDTDSQVPSLDLQRVLHSQVPLHLNTLYILQA